MDLKLLPNISRNLPCDVATLQGVLDNATQLLENHQKGGNEVWATDHTPPYLRFGNFFAFNNNDSISFPDSYRLHPREEFTIIFKNFTREHLDGKFWLVLGQTTSSSALCMSLEEPFSDNPGEILFKISNGSVTSSALSVDFDLRHHDNVELGIVYNGSTIAFYKNGVWINTVSVISDPINYIGQMYIGGDHTASNEISSELKDWSFWGKGFSSAEVLTYFGNHTDPYPDELRIELAINDGTGTDIVDSADPTKWGIEFDSLTQTPIDSQEELICIDNFTLFGECYWIENTYATNAMMIKGGAVAGGCNYRVAVDKATRKIMFSTYYLATWTHVISDLTVRAGHYSNWAVRISGSVIEFYIDGVWDTKVLSGIIRSYYFPLKFGKNYSYGDSWTGHLRNTGIAQAFLSDSEVEDIFASTPILPASCVGYWTLRNGTGNTFDSLIVEDGNDFTIGTSGVIPHDAMQNTSVEGTFLINVYIDDLTAITTDRDIFSKTTFLNTDYRLFVNSSDQLVFYHNGPTLESTGTSHYFDEKKWYEILIILEGNSLRIVFNGSPYTTTLTDSVRTNSGGDLIFGSSPFNSAIFPGFIRGFKQWDHALSSVEEDELLYDRIFPTSGLVVDCDINEGTGSTFNDDASDYRLDI